MINMVKASVSFFFFSLFFCHAALAFVEVQETKTEQGISVWVVEDTSVPVVSMSFAFRGGIALEEEGKEGLTNLLSEVLLQGAGTYDNASFQRRLENLSTQMEFSTGRDYFYGNMKMLSRHKQESFLLLRTVLSAPRFDTFEMKKVKQQIIAGIEQDQQSPNWLLWRNFNKNYYQNHPYSNPGQGKIETVPNITVEDIRSFIDNNFSKDRLDVVFVGDISLEEAQKAADYIFQNLPQQSPVNNLTRVEHHHIPQKEKETLFVDFPTTQSFILMVKEGFDQNDPDYAAATVANYLIGGGSFSSRLMEDIRVKQGLTYGIHSSYLHQNLSNLFVIQTRTKTETTDKMLKEIEQTLQEIVDDGFSLEEIEKAKTYLIGSQALSLTSTDTISSALLGMKLEGFDKNYLEKRVEQLKAVSLVDVKRVLMRLFANMDFFTVIVGEKSK